ncbi:MAG: membrane protein insertion efficiency factor YidD [Clostridia bacterium]
MNNKKYNITEKMIGFYKKNISTAFGKKCRYTPSCSSYMLQSINKFGVIKGTTKGFYRILRCNPFSKGGDDFVSENLKGDYKWLM